MKPSSRPPRTPSRLSDSLHRQLDKYALAASAAGMGVLALASPTEAKIVYTRADEQIGDQTILDFNPGRTTAADFRFQWGTSQTESGGGVWLSVFPDGDENGIWGTDIYASALQAGVRVGPNKGKFRQGHDLMWISWRGWTSWTRGPWANVQHAYLGLKFFFQGRAHYGWARISKSTDIFFLTGYAYETIPNKPIIAGKTKGPDVIAFQPASLGRLAQGSTGLAAWQQK